MRKNVEILAPCGSMDILKAAVNAGSDACYLGGDKFGARAYATNFNQKSIIEAIDYAHSRESKVYLTINTLFKNNEIQYLYDYLNPLYLEGLDAVIVQDFGVFDFVHQKFPDLSIHCSTQMNITSSLGAEYVKELGASRVVTARELSLNEIKSIKDKVDIEIETFVHGALCFAYSGQCLMSSLAGGRSGNRGRCAQPCRKLYDGKYKLSLKDMCTISNIPSIIESGIDSLKIEGRMKNEYYTALAVDSYKELVSDYFNNSFSINKAKELEYKMANVFNRGGFCTGYLVNDKDKNMLTTKRPNHQGVKIGTLTRIVDNKVYIKLSADVKKMDILEVLLKDNSIIELTSNVEGKKDETIILNGSKISQISLNKDVYRIKSNYIQDDIYNNIINNPKKIQIDGKANFISGEKASLTIWLKSNKNISYKCEDIIVDDAKNKALDYKTINDKLNKLGETQFVFSNLDIEIGDNVFIPIGAINNLRRNAIDGLVNVMVNDSKRDNIKSDADKYKMNNLNTNSEMTNNDNTINSQFNLLTNINNDSNQIPDTKSKNKIEYNDLNNGYLIASCLYKHQLDILLKNDKISEIYIDITENDFIKYQDKKELIELLDLTHNNNKKLILQLPNVVKENNLNTLNKFDDIIDLFDGYYVPNIDGFGYLIKKNLLDKLIVIGSTLYTYNDNAIKHFSINNNVIFECPLELNVKEINNLQESNKQVKIYGNTRVMITNQCYKNNFSNCNKNFKEFITIRDDKNNDFLIKGNCNMCYNSIYNGIPLVLFNKDNPFTNNKSKIDYRIDFTNENETQTREVINNCSKWVFEGIKTKVDYNYTTGHYYRGVE